MTRSADVETVVVGGGAVGLAIGAECAERGQNTLVLEKNGALGQEVSARSSEVIHSGIYYPPGSIRARVCVEGNTRLYSFAQENGIGFKKTGKLIVATSESEMAALRAIHKNGIQNGVQNLRWLDAGEARAMENDLFCAAALWVPSTGIFDSATFITALEGRLTTHGGAVVRACIVRRARLTENGLFEIETASSGSTTTLTAQNLFVAAGLGMADLGPKLPRRNGYAPPKLFFAKGHYFGLAGPSPFTRLIYPIPVAGGLGTHLTLDLQGRARFGPDVCWVDDIDYAFADPDGTLKTRFETAIRHYWPGLPDGALEPATTGIRPKISAEGEPARDFAIHTEADHGIPRMVTLYGIESPGLTSALAIGAMVAGEGVDKPGFRFRGSRAEPFSQ